VSPGDRLVVGLVRGFHGLRGTVRVESLTARAQERVTVGRSLFVEGGDTPLTIVEAQPDAQGWRLRFAEVADRTAAERLRDVYLEAIVAPGEQLPRGEFYWHEVIGASVTDVDGTALGEVTDVYRAGGAEVVVVRGPAGEVDVPLVRAMVRIFAPARGEIVVDGEALGLRGAGEEAAGEPGTAPAADANSTAGAPPAAGTVDGEGPVQS
jgi:16S rRNA processing protein RimM